MAAAQTYNFSDTNLESWEDVVTMVSPTDAPLYTGLGKTSVSATRHEWAKDTLATAAINKNVEGATMNDGSATARTYDYNYTQIHIEKWSITGSQEEVAKAGVDNEWDYQAEKAMKQIVNDIEYALVNGTGNSGASATEREMRGALTMITTSNTTGSATGSETLTETMFNDALQDVWSNGGQPNWVLANGTQRRKISAFVGTTNTVQNVDATEKSLTATVKYYDSDFGVVQIDLERYLPADEILILDKSKWKVGQLRPLKQDPDLARSGDAYPGAWIAENTLVGLNEASSGKITQLATS